MAINNILPEGWEMVKLGDACQVIMGQSPPSTSYNTEGIGLPFFQGKAEFTDLHPIVEKWCSTPNKIAEPNDILLSVRAPVGTTNIADARCCIGRGLAAIRFNNYKYGFYFLRSKQQELDSKGTGTTFRAVSGETIRETLFPLPPVETQQNIVSKIEELFSEIDKGIETLRTAQQQLKVYRQAVLKWAFEGKLTNVDMKDGELPRGWDVLRLKEIAAEISDGDHQAPPKSISGVPFITISNVNKANNKIDFSNTFSVTTEYYVNLKMNRRPQKGDVLYTVTGSFGIPILIDFDKEFCFQRHIGLIRPLVTTNQKWLYYLLQSPLVFNQAKETATGTAQKTVALNSLRNFEVPYCSIETQERIVEEIESRLSVADKMDETIAQSLQQAEVLKQSILKQAFEGKLVQPRAKEIYKPGSEYFYQCQLLGLIAKTSKQKGIHHGEMTIAKYAYLVDKVYKIPTYYDYQRWHLGPYPPVMKKAINNKKFFAKGKSDIEVSDEATLFKYANHYQNEIVAAVNDLTEIFSKYPVEERAHKTELLATVCKVVEDIKTIELQQVRASMKDWKIDLKNSPFTNKAEKFSVGETNDCILFIEKHNWNAKLIK